MSKPVFLAFNAAFILAYSAIANLLGRGQTSAFQISREITNPNASNIFDQVMAPILWTFEAVGMLLSMVTFAFIGVDPMVFLFVIGPLAVIDIVIVIGMVRGGGT